MKNGQKIWTGILSSVKSQVSSSAYKTWFLGAFVLDYKQEGDGNVLVVGVKNSFLKEQMEKKYLPLVLEGAKEQGIECEVVFQVSKTLTEKEEPKAAPLFSGIAPTYIGSFRKSDALNPTHTFDNFVVGSSNNLAHMAFSQASKTPGALYNPLFVYGPTGVGKTHLMQAFGNSILNNVLDAKVLYVSAEKFTNDYIESLNNRTQQAFR